jgi:hypothetical protein
MRLHFQKREEGSSLFVAMIICGVVGVILAGYLLLTSNRFQMTVRSSDWNAAIPVLEAGIEEALAHLTRDTNTPTANNWTSATIAGNVVYTKKRYFSDGSYYYVYIKDYSANNPSIYSSGYVRSPYSTNKYIVRNVVVGVTNPPTVWTHAIAVSGGVSFVGHPVVDSYDDRKGPYNASTNRDGAINIGGIATNAKNSGAVSLGGAHVYGPVTTGPGGVVSGGTVGDVAWNATSSGIEPGWTNNTMNVAYPSNSVPTGGPWVGPSQYTNITTGTYQMSSFTSSGDVTISGNVVWYVTGNLKVKGNDIITIKAGGSLKIIAGGDVDLGGGGVLNQGGNAANFSIIGLNSCTSVNYHGTAQFIGTVNAPQADFSLSGTTDAFGAIIAYSASMNGNTALHYPESLAYQDGYIASSWREF